MLQSYSILGTLSLAFQVLVAAIMVWICSSVEQWYISHVLNYRKPFKNQSRTTVSLAIFRLDLSVRKCR